LTPQDLPRTFNWRKIPISLVEVVAPDKLDLWFWAPWFDLLWRTSEGAQNKTRLAASIPKNSLRFRVIAKTTSPAANPQYQDSALNPAAQLAGCPADTMPG
jgi:hypothetical protein